MTSSYQAVHTFVDLPVTGKSQLPDGLVGAYLDTDYIFEYSGQEYTMQIGELCVCLDQLLTKRAMSSAAFLTAFNPLGEELSLQENMQRQRQLIESIVSAGLDWYGGRGQGRDKLWPPEPSILVVGMTKPVADECGQRFAQNAYVLYERGVGARVVLLR